MTDEPTSDDEIRLIKELSQMGFEGSLTLNEIMRIDPEIRAAFNPEPTFWDTLVPIESDLPEWCSPDWIGPWEQGGEER